MTIVTGCECAGHAHTDELDWPGLLARAWFPPDRAEITRCLDLVAVCRGRFGVRLLGTGGGMWRGRCPFHDAARPTFYVRDLSGGVQDCGCWVCEFGHGNDVLALVGRFWGGTDEDVRREALSLLDTGRYPSRYEPGS